ncbi:MAG: bifunctional diaminohydroxyphosphoribosylaminopyrimidine deaminase/5-amino-6-(5-phosphoribosylamino)uracil reductase RibD, partial [Hyphomicrobiales bacterium]
MSLALRLARRGMGRVWPNPSVGALVVRPGDLPQVVGRGWTMPGGRPHAEKVAIDRAGAAARGATLYVTLEPCCHKGRAEPCTDVIIGAGISRVVCATGDPDVRVAGEGFEKLRRAGIEVTTGVLEHDARLAAMGHILRVTEGRPLVTLKVAVGSDGLVPRGEGSPVWVTGEQARGVAHLMRAMNDAILVGRATVEADNPELTCRLPGMEDQSPIRIVLDSDLATPAGAKLARTASRVPLWIFCKEDPPSDRARNLSGSGAEIVRIGRNAAGLDIGKVLAAAAARGITRLLVEGG